MNTPDHPDAPDTPPPDEARAQLHDWLDTCDDVVVVALWQLARRLPTSAQAGVT
jgi:hypothetical protein